MNYLVVYSSNTGNTEQIAKTIYKFLPDTALIQKSNVTVNMESFDIVFVGYWIDKGACDKNSAGFLKQLHSKKVVLFGTMGASDTNGYGARMARTAAAQLPEDNELLGSFICQGKIPAALKQRYIEILKRDPENESVRKQLENHEESQTHPDARDIKKAVDFTHEILKKLR